MKKNHSVNLRLSEKTRELLDEITLALGISKSLLIRTMLNKGLLEIKSDAIKSGGYKNLEITFREI